MTNSIQTPSTWWGKFRLQSEQSQQWHIGPLTLIIRRMDSEWQIGHTHQKDFSDDNVNWEINDTDQLPDTLDSNSRYVFHDKKRNSYYHATIGRQTRHITPAYTATEAFPIRNVDASLSGRTGNHSN